MQQFLTDNPDLLAQALNLTFGLVGIAIAWAAARVGKRAGIDIEQTHIDRINAAIRHVAIESLADGRTDMAEIARNAGAYLRQHLPDAMKAVHPSPDAIRTIAAAHLARVIEVPHSGPLRPHDARMRTLPHAGPLRASPEIRAGAPHLPIPSARGSTVAPAFG